MPTLADRYQLAELIYSDADVVAYCAHDDLLNRTVTVELLQAGRPDEPQRVARMLAKARQAALTNLPHVAALYDQHTIDGRPFLVLEEPLGPALAEAAPLTAAEMVGLVRQVAETLRAALTRQLPQPALNQATLRLGPDGRVQILDLGLDQPALTEPGAVRQLGQLISVGLSDSSEWQSAPLQRIAEAALGGQYPTIDALLAALQQIEQRAAQPTTVLPRVTPTVDVHAAAVDDATQVVVPEARPARRRGLMWAALGLGLLALVIGGLLLRPRAETAQQPESSPVASAASAGAVRSPAASPANGALFVVATNNGQALIVRSGPGRSFSRITSIPNGSTVEVLEGPQAADGFNWVRIRTASVEGWCVSEALRRR